jgi:hypothetical protein
LKFATARSSNPKAEFYFNLSVERKISGMLPCVRANRGRKTLSTWKDDRSIRFDVSK